MQMGSRLCSCYLRVDERNLSEGQDIRIGHAIGYHIGHPIGYYIGYT